MQVKSLKVFDDNYIWLLVQGTDVIVIDPGSDSLVSNYIIANDLRLKAILITHNHNDHIAGVKGLTNKYNVPVYALSDIATKLVANCEVINIANFPSIKVIYTPGHTLDGVSYLVKDGIDRLFCGDTLFAGGCGRVFTNNYLAMYNSLDSLAKLDPKLELYPAHEYTLNNLKFLHSIIPENEPIKLRLMAVNKLIKSNEMTLPTTLELELTTNLFLKCNDKKLCNKLAEIYQKPIIPGVDCFTKLRQLKDRFNS